MARPAQPVPTQLLGASQYRTPPRQAATTQVPGGAPPGWSARPHQAGASAPPLGTVRRRDPPEAGDLPALWPRAVGRGRRTAAPPGVGTPRDQAAGGRIPAAPAGLPLLRRDDVRGTAAGRAHGAVGAAAGGLRRAAHSLLPPEQATHGPVPGNSPE